MNNRLNKKELFNLTIDICDLFEQKLRILKNGIFDQIRDQQNGKARSFIFKYEVTFK